MCRGRLLCESLENGIWNILHLDEGNVRDILVVNNYYQ